MKTLIEISSKKTAELVGGPTASRRPGQNGCGRLRCLFHSNAYRIANFIDILIATLVGFLRSVLRLASARLPHNPKSDLSFWRLPRRPIAPKTVPLRVRSPLSKTATDPCHPESAAFWRARDLLFAFVAAVFRPASATAASRLYQNKAFNHSLLRTKFNLTPACHTARARQIHQHILSFGRRVFQEKTNERKGRKVTQKRACP